MSKLLSMSVSVCMYMHVFQPEGPLVVVEWFAVRSLTVEVLLWVI